MGTRAFVGCDSKRKGDASEALALWKLSEAGLTVLIPWGDNARFDLVAVIGDKLRAYAGRLATKLTWSSNPGCVWVASSTRAGNHPCSSQLTAGIRIACTGTPSYDLSVNVRPGALKVSQVCRPHG